MLFVEGECNSLSRVRRPIRFEATQHFVVRRQRIVRLLQSTEGKPLGEESDPDQSL